jgi:AcrR family transcriptional regulator
MCTLCNCENWLMSDELRERRRQAVAHGIHRSALRLAREQGFETLTIDAIAADASVSRRTFFNYFPSKEAAIVHGPPVLPRAIPDAGSKSADAAPRVVLNEAIEMLIGDLEWHRVQRQQLHDILAVANAHPTVFAALLAKLELATVQLSAVIAARLGVSVDDESAQLLAAVAMLATRIGMERWRSEVEASTTSTSPAGHIRRAVSLLEHMLAD